MSWPLPYRSWECRLRKQGGQGCIVSHEDDNAFFFKKLHAMMLTAITSICANLSSVSFQPCSCRTNLLPMTCKRTFKYLCMGTWNFLEFSTVGVCN